MQKAITNAFVHEYLSPTRTPAPLSTLRVSTIRGAGLDAAVEPLDTVYCSGCDLCLTTGRCFAFGSARGRPQRIERSGQRTRT